MFKKCDLITICILIDFKMAVIINHELGLELYLATYRMKTKFEKCEKLDRKLFWLVWIFKDEVISTLAHT